MKSMENRKQNIIAGTAISFFFAFTVLFYGPLSLYLPNSEEFWFKLSDLMKVIVPFSLAAFIGAGVVLALLPEKISSFFIKLFFGVSLAFYIQGNYININYGTGVLDGSKIDWSKYTTYGIINTAIWAAAIILPFIVCWIIDRRNAGEKKKESDIHITSLQVLAIAAAFFTLIQIPALTAQSLSYHPNESTEFTILDKGEFELSDKDNIVMFILDTMDEAYYQDFIKAHPEYTKELTGFTHYDNAVTSGARTPIAVPSMFTGKPFTRKETYSKYKSKVWGEENALSVLNDAGYDIGFYSEAVLFSRENVDYISNFSDTGAKVGSEYKFLKKVYKLDLYKFLPHFLKRYVWFDTAEFDSAMETDKNSAFVLNDYDFMQDYKEQGFTVSQDNDKIMRIYHMKAAHQPYSLLEDGTKNQDGKATLQSQNTAIMNFVAQVLSDMKDKGVYDDSVIIILADHGDLDLKQWPMFLLKEKGAEGEYKTDHAPVSFYDLPVYLAGFAGKELKDQKYASDLLALKEGDKRTRYFVRHSGGINESIIEEYTTEGNAGDPDSFKLKERHEDSDVEAEPYVLGTELDFGIEETGNQYAEEGFATNTGMRTILRGPYAKLVIPLKDVPSSGDLSVFIKTSKATIGKRVKHPLIVKANGEEVLETVTDNKLAKEGIKFKVPADKIGKDKKLTIELNFTDIPMDEMEKDIQDRTEHIRFVKMVIDKD